MHTPHANNNLNNSKSTSTSLNAPNGTADADAGLEDEGGGDGEPANPADKPHSQSEYQSHYQALLNNTVTYNAQGQPGPSPDPDIIYANATKLIPPRSQQTQTQAVLGPASPAIPAAPYGTVPLYSAGAQLKSPKSPRPQISVEITPATPKSVITASSTFGSIPPSAATTTSQSQSQPQPPSSQKQPLSGPSSAAPKPTQGQVQVQSRPLADGPGSGLSSPHEAVHNWVQSQAASPTTPHSPHTHTSTSHPASPHKPNPSKGNGMPAEPAADKYADSRGRRPSNASQRSQPYDHPRPPSAAGSTSGGEGHGKFSLRDLLSSGPKLSRKNSASSKKSVSSGGGGGGGGGMFGFGGTGGGGGKSGSKAGSAKGSKAGSAKGSTAGESALESKYGIYGKMAVGKGATSVVRLAHKWDRTEEKLYAVKEFRPRRNKESERDYVKKLTSEFCIASALRQPNVVETVDLMQDNEGKWCVVMEFCPGGDLYNAIRKGGMSPAEVECCFKQILTGVGYLHAQGVAHRDLKPENLFFDARGQVKIGDFGASTVFRLPWEQTIHKSGGLCGSEPYIAPEQFAQPVSYDARLVDVWACGIVYYCLHFSELPWSCAQPSDKTYAQYAQQCASPGLTIANIPFLKTPASLSGFGTPITPGAGTPNRQDSTGTISTMSHLGVTPATPGAMTPSGLTAPNSPFGPSTPSGLTTPSGLPIQSRAERDKEQQREQAAAYPSTIHHLSPRACRPVLRRMLEPKPEYRVTIEEVLKHPWVQSIEVCTLPGVVPKHIHPAAIAAAAAGGIVGDKYDK